MRPLLFAIAMTFATSTGALAFCPAFPDDGTTHYVENQTALMLCQQAELAAATATANRLVELQASLAAAQLAQLELQRKLAESFALDATTMPNFF